MAARLRTLTRPVRKHAVQHVERLAYLLRIRVRPEVPNPAAVPLAREHDTGKLVLDGNRDVRKGFVVTEPHVERRPVTLHEVLLEMERLDLVLRDDHLDVLDPLRKLANGGARVDSGGLEVRANARPQRLRLADVEDVALAVAEEVDARLRGNRLQLFFKSLSHTV